MSKKPVLADVTNTYTSSTTINNNNDLIEASFENTLSLDGSTPNNMEADFDLNSNDILNAGTIYTNELILQDIPLLDLLERIEAASETIDETLASLEKDLNAMTHFTTLEDFKAAIVDGFTREDGERVEAGGVEYTALSTNTQFDGLDGWAIIPRDSDQLPRGNFAINDYFAGAYKTLWGFESTDETTYTGGRSTMAISRVVDGSGQAGVGQADVGMHVVAAKNDLYGETPGEVDAMKVNVFSDGHSDAGGILIGAYKHVGDGTIDEGGLTPIEVSSRRFTDDLSTYEHLHQSIIGFSPNPQSAWGGRNPIGFYSENHEGAGFANFLGISDGANGDVGTMEYLIAGFHNRDLSTRYFSVDDQGNMESRSFSDDASASPIWSLYRDSESPAENDLIGRMIYRGRNDAGDEVDYVRASGSIRNVGSGVEDGQYQLDTLVDGVRQTGLTLRNGVSIGNVAPQGGGTLNLAGALLVDGTSRIDASGNVTPNTVVMPSGAVRGEQSGTPEGSVTAIRGSIYTDTDSGATYLKLTPTGNTGWQRITTEADLVSLVSDFIAAAEFPTYAEGDFVPELTCATPGTLSITSTNTGNYTRIGNKVSTRMRFAITNVTKGTASGEFRIDFSDLGLVPVDDLGHGSLIRLPAQINVPQVGGQDPMNLGVSIDTGADYATVTFGTRDFSNQVMNISALEEVGISINIDVEMEFYV